MKILRWVLALGVGAMVAGVMAAGQAVPAGQTAEARMLAFAGKQMVILDTDIGDDIDDAFALGLVLKSPELKLIGITTAYGDTELRANLVDRYIGAAGRSDIPVASGDSTEANNVFTQAAYARSHEKECQVRLTSLANSNEACFVGGRKHPDAAGFLLDHIRARPGEITLIAIGPLNNIEEAIKRDAETFRKLKRVVMMGGSIYRGYGEHAPPQAEWNISRDPAGLRALLASGVPVFMMPLDSTQIHLGTKERELIFAHGSPVTDQLTLLYHQWKAGSEGHPDAPTLFDPVAVAYAIRPELCPATPLRIEVDDKGFTKPVEGAPNAQVCLKSDEKGFMDLLLDRLTGDGQN
jgi:inosine-uridine nucleoside N-ribohydrolase